MQRGKPDKSHADEFRHDCHADEFRHDRSDADEPRADSSDDD